MDGCFHGVPTDSIERWFSGMIVYDVAMPHTRTRVSPITFTEYLIRNSILCLNQEQVYDQMNKFWRRYLNVSGNILDKLQNEKGWNLSICEEEHPGWSKLVDYFNRILDVQKFDGNKYYQMHYLSHCCHLFYHETWKNQEEQDCNRTIFNEIMSPILYEPCIPVQRYIWLPVMNFADVRFHENLVTLCAKVSSFIESHSGRSMNFKQFDQERLKFMMNIVKGTLTDIHNNKYNDELWKVPLSLSIAKLNVINADMKSCEMYDSFDRDGMKCIGAMRELQGIRKRFEQGEYNDAPDDAIDSLLDAYTVIQKGLKSYNIPEEAVK